MNTKYPKYSQEEQQPGSPFGSGTAIASLHPDREVAKKIKAIQLPEQIYSLVAQQ